MDAMCQGELRATKGALIFIPEGTEHYLRVETKLVLPDGFRTGKARVKLVQRAREVRAAAKLEKGLHPAHGIPERASGTVSSRTGDELILDVEGIPLTVNLASTASVPEGPVTVVLDEPLRAEQAELS